MPQPDRKCQPWLKNAHSKKAETVQLRPFSALGRWANPAPDGAGESESGLGWKRALAGCEGTNHMECFPFL